MGRVMVVDDEPDMRMALRLFLERQGHEVTEASDGEQALAALKSGGPFDLALLDMRMPGLDGMQTLARIRETNNQMPVIMVTGYGSMESAAEVLEKGANHYVSKPFKHEELRDAMVKIGLSAEPVAGESSTEEDEGYRIPPTAAIAALAVLLGAACLGGAWRMGWLTSRDYKLPYANPVDMAWKDGKIYIADWMTQAIYVHSARRGLPVIKTYFLPDIHISGLALSGDQLFTSDSWARKIRRHRLDDTLTVIGTYPSPGPSPTSLFCDGKYLWSVDSKEGKIYQQRLDANLTVVAEYKSPGKSPVGFYKDEKYAWSSDSQTRRLYMMRLDDRLTPVAAYSLEDLEQRQEPLSCFTWVGSNIWFARDRLSVLYRRNAHWLHKL